MFSNLFKAVVSVAVSPIAAVADVLTLPANEMNDEPIFGRTRNVLKNAGDCFKEAVKPE